jgi:hypothetical protein
MLGEVGSLAPWLFFAAVVVMVVRMVPRVLRDLRGPLPDVGSAPEDAEPVAFILPNDDGLFTWSMRYPERPPAATRQE